MFKAAELIHSKMSLKIRFPDSWNFIPALPTFDRKQMSLEAVSSGSESEEQRKGAWEKTLQLVDVTDRQRSCWDMGHKAHFAAFSQNRMGK